MNGKNALAAAALVGAAAYAQTETVNADIVMGPWCDYYGHNAGIVTNTGWINIDDECNSACQSCYGQPANGAGELNYWWSESQQSWLWEMICYCQGS